MSNPEASSAKPVDRKRLSRVTIRFAGDSGDGMQLTGTHFTNTSALFGNDVRTLPNFPAEIRAPAGSLPGVSAFQLCFADEAIFTPGDRPDVLVAMNPAALKANISDLAAGASIIVNSDEFTSANLKRVGYETNPLEDDSLSKYRIYEVPITTLNQRSLEGSPVGTKEINRCKNFFSLGLMCWLYNRSLDPTIKLIDEKFAPKSPNLADANRRALLAGHAFGETAEMFGEAYVVSPASLEPGEYLNITGNRATALGFVTAAKLADRELFYGSYPITPASDVLHELSRLKNFGVKTFQAEDEIAAMCSIVGAAFGGSLALTGTSGPGLALKSEAIGMAVMTELPVVIIDVQRAGPSTGMPTKTEQSDLLQAMFGRNGECPVAVVAPGTPAECFTMAIEASRIAVRHMTPVMYLSDGYLANGSEPWKIPNVEDLQTFKVESAQVGSEPFLPYLRDAQTLARPWAVPGTPGLEHRIGTIEKQEHTGNVSYDPENHDRMVRIRAEKIARIAYDIPEQEVFGSATGKVLVVGWGSTFGAIRGAVKQHQDEGYAVSHAHMRYINPFPRNLEALFKQFETVLIPELNLGQLRLLVRAEYLVDAIGFNKVTGQPFAIDEIYGAIKDVYSEKSSQIESSPFLRRTYGLAAEAHVALATKNSGNGVHHG